MGVVSNKDWMSSTFLASSSCLTLCGLHLIRGWNQRGIFRERRGLDDERAQEGHRFHVGRRSRMSCIIHIAENAAARSKRLKFTARRALPESVARPKLADAAPQV